MGKTFLSFLAATMLVGSLAVADSHGCNTSSRCGTTMKSRCGSNNDCGFGDFDCDMCDGWSLSGQWLFWNVRACDLDYAFDYDGTSAEGKIHHVCPEFDHGFRIRFDKTCNDLALGVNYTYYRADAKGVVMDAAGDVAGTHILEEYNDVAHGSINYASGNYKLDYDVIDLTAHHKVELTKCIDAYFGGGVKIAFVDQAFHALYSDNVDPANGGAAVDLMKTTVETDAYGIDLGMGGMYKYSEGLSLKGCMGVDLLFANSDRHYTYQSGATGTAGLSGYDVDLKDDCWSTVTVLNVSLGLVYDICDFFDCVDTSISAGYEFHNWMGCTGFLFHHSDDATVNGSKGFDRGSSSLGYDGLNLGLNFKF